MLNRIRPARVLLRTALGASFLSAVAARLGLWGDHTGNLEEAFATFREYVVALNPWLPRGAIPVLAVGVTLLEGSIGLALVAGFRTRQTALAAGVLLTAFALAMSAFTGIKSALDYSVWSAAMGAFVLFGCDRVELDHVPLEVSDPTAAARFFASVLGMPPVRLNEFRDGRAPFPSVRVGDGTLIDLFPRRFWSGDTSQNPNHLCFSLSPRALERLRRTLSERDIVISKTNPHNFGARGFGRSVYFEGPEGVQLEARTY